VLAHTLKVIDVKKYCDWRRHDCRNWPLMQTAFQQQLRQDLIPVLRDKLNIVISSMGDQAGMIGAACYFNKKILAYYYGISVG
jgi:glucokinase